MPSNALRSSATGQSLIRPDSASLSETSFTIMGWTYISSNRAATASVFSLPGDAYFYYNVQIKATTLVLSTWQNTTEVNGSTLAVGRWYHIAETVSGTGAGQWLVYLNGALDITNAGTTGVNNSGIGVFTNPDNQWHDGRASNIMVWTVPLNIDEIKAQMFRTRPVVRLHKLNGWYPFKNGPYEAGRDYSGLYVPGNQNHFMVTGALTDEPGPLLQLGN